MMRGARTRLHKFYLIKPRENANIDELAERLISLKNVVEVLVTDGDYGFVVKAKFSTEKDTEEAEKYIHNNIDRKFGVVTSHYRYGIRAQPSSAL